MYSLLSDADIDFLWKGKVAVIFGLQSDEKCRSQEPGLPFVAQLIPNNRKWFHKLNNCRNASTVILRKDDEDIRNL